LPRRDLAGLRRGFSLSVFIVQTFNRRARVDAKIFCLYIAGMGKARGRPKLTKKERREIRFQIRLSPEELAQIERAGGDAPSTWARDTLLRAAKQGLK
jgi:hypothetical protein